MKKLVVIAMIGIMSVGLTSCKKDENKTSNVEVDKIVDEYYSEVYDKLSDEEKEIFNSLSDEEKETIKEEIEEVGKYLKMLQDYEIDEVAQFKETEKGETIAIIKTNYGDIKVKFLDEYAPLAVENFIGHAKNGYYDGLTFHRTIENFMIQGGDPKGTGIGGVSIWGDKFKDELHKGARHFNGALAMANAGPNTNGSQFFIVNTSTDLSEQIADTRKEKDVVIAQLANSINVTVDDLYPEIILDKYEEVGGTIHLDYSHTVFGQVIEGMEIVDKISKVEVDEASRPIEPVIIESIEITEY